jgi:hypothetical protein
LAEDPAPWASGWTTSIAALPRDRRLLSDQLFGASRRRNSHPPDLDACDVVWTSASHDASGSMPIGNGEVGLNVWVEEGGDLLFLVSRTDAWSETCRLLKLGRVRVHLDPSPFATDVPFRQTLALRSGCIEIEAGKPGEEVRLLVFVDSELPIVRVVGESAKPVRVTASLECWRNERHVLKGQELQSS